MEAGSPARLYASAVGALLLILGVVGFFYSASFGAPGTVADALGAFRVNAWLNLLHAAVGTLGLLAASWAPRAFALAAGFGFTALAVWGFAIGAGDAVLGFVPAGAGDDWLHLGLGIAGLLAAAGTQRRPHRAREPTARRSSEPRADAAGEGA